MRETLSKLGKLTILAVIGMSVLTPATAQTTEQQRLERERRTREEAEKAARGITRQLFPCRLGSLNTATPVLGVTVDPLDEPERIRKGLLCRGLVCVR